MARRLAVHHSGFQFSYTDLNAHVFPPKDACITDALGLMDLDGDGILDFIAIGTASGDHEDTDHEVVAIHTPSGDAMWRALRGEASRKLGLIGTVLVVSTNSGQRLRGLDPRTGQQLWVHDLEDALEVGSFDHDDRAPTIAPIGGPWAAFQCVDETAWVIDVRNGQIVHRATGKLHAMGWNLPGYVGIETEVDGDTVIDLFSPAHNRSIYRVPDGAQVCTLHGTGYFGLMHRAELPRRAGYASKVTVFEQQSGQPVVSGWLQADGDAFEHGESKYGLSGGYLLGKSRILFGDPCNDDSSAFVGDIKPDAIGAVQPLQPARAGYSMQGLAWCAPVFATVWKKTKGTEKLVVAGLDPTSLELTWVADGFGGYHHENLMHVTGHAILAPRSTASSFSPTNPSCLVHLDPATGAKVTEYPIEATDCVGVVDQFLVGCPDHFSGGVPVIYDTSRRERVL